MNGKKRAALVAGSVTAVGAVATLIAGTTFGLFSAQQTSGNSTFSTGTVSIGQGTPSTPCAITDLMPGDSSADVGRSPCTFTVTNGSSAPSYAAVDVLIATDKAASAPTKYGDTTAIVTKNLYDGTNTTGLHVSISDGTNSFTVPVTANAVTCPTGTDPLAGAVSALTLPSTDACYEVKNLLLSASAVPGTNSPPAALSSLTVSWSLPALTTGNEYEGGEAVIAMNAHEVQQAHNTLNCSPSAGVGQSCTPGSGFSWS